MKLVRGAPGSGRTSLVLSEFKQALKSGLGAMRIVVPTATLVRHLQNELARDGVVFSPNLIVSLSRFLEERAAPARLVPDALLRAVVEDVSRPTEFPEFGAVAGTGGMTSTLIDTIDLFENAGCTPEKLAGVRKLTPEARAFQKIWSRASARVSHLGYAMRGDLVRAAAANRQPLRVWMDGFLTFGQLERELIEALAKSCNLTLTLPDSPAVDEVRRLALRLGAEDRLLSGASRKPATTVVAARSVEREADEIARRILSLRERGTAFRQIGVALRDSDTYAPLLQGTFERFGIPARFYFRSPLRNHPVATLLGGLVSGALNGWDFEGALETLRAHPRLGTRADFDRFDFTVREAMPGLGAQALLSLCEPEWLRSEISICMQTASWLNDKLTAEQWKNRLESLATSVYRPGTLSISARPSDVESQRSHVAGLRAWLRAVESIQAFWGESGQAVSLEEFWRIASQAIAAAMFEAVDDRANVVHVLSVYEARQWDLSALFVCGVADRDFPKQQPQNLLFPDSDIDRLRAAGIPLRKGSDQDSDEKWLFESLKTRAADSLFLSYAEHNAAGKSVQPSRFLSIDRAFQNARTCRPVPEFAAARVAVGSRIYSENLHAEMTRLHQSVSLTALEDLAQCRFKFFGGRTLSLKGRPEIPARRLNPRVTGSILHVALERWVADRQRDFVEIFEEAFDEACRTEHLPAGYRLEVDRMIFRDIASSVSANELWEAADSLVEQDVTLDFPGGVTVKGRIDRIDRFGRDCVIIDYKSSKTANVQKLVSSPTRLQGPLYALAVREKLDLNPVAVIFWAVRDDQRYGWGKIPGKDIEFEAMPGNWATDARSRTVERLSSFLQGDVRALPEDTEQCRWCDFVNACRVEAPALVMIESAGSA